MCNKRIKTIIALIVTLLSAWSLVQADTVEIKAVNSPADLDLSGNIVYAVNFGNNGNPNIGGIVFSQDQDCPDVTVAKTSEDLATLQGGAYPDTGDSELDKLLVGLAWQNSGGNFTTSITVRGLEVGMQYQLQLIFYTDHSRPMDIIVEGSIVAEWYDPFIAQGSVDGKGGSMVKYHFTAGDNTLNFNMTSTNSQASVISGFILTEKGPVPFTDYGSGTTIELFAGGATWQLKWGQGPWTWSELTGLPLLDSNVSGILDLRTTASAAVSTDLIATLPIAGTLTLSAHDEDYEDVTIGTMVLSGAGINVIDINASRVLVDEGSGMFLAPFHPPAPKVTLTLEEATGVFAYINQVGDWDLSLAGSYAIPLIKGLGLQDNIYTALGGKVPLIGGIATFALTGQYIPDMSKKPIAFCEYGTGSTAQLAPGGGGWDQQWGLGPWDWFTRTVETNTPFLNENVTGKLTTQATGQPTISEDLILHLPLAGQMVLTEHAADNSEDVAGQITCDVTATFVVDMNAERAVVNDAEGTITVAFGTSVEEGPDGLMTVTETTGTFADIKQVCPWKWYVNGTMQCARVPGLSVQDNLLAALQQAELLLGAQEEFVLSGLYYRSSPEE
jgi:hypothetical protein